MLQTQEQRQHMLCLLCNFWILYINLLMELLIFKNMSDCSPWLLTWAQSNLLLLKNELLATRIAPRIHDFHLLRLEWLSTCYRHFWDNLAVRSVVSISLLLCMRLKRQFEGKNLKTCRVFATFKWPTTASTHKIKSLIKGSKNCYQLLFALVHFILA